MASAQLNGVLRHLRSVRETQALVEASDGQLVERFMARRDEAAFAALMRRHGAMVLSVSNRVLHHRQDAEDVFQATFLLLAKKAGAIHKRESVASWLHGVAHRLALKARTQAVRRRLRETQAAERRPADFRAEAWQEVQAALDAALSELPQKYRAVLVLCCLEGKSLKQAAHILGCPVATVGTYVARGRKLLRSRLTKHGLTLSTAGIVSLLLASAASAAAPAALSKATAKAAAALAAGHKAATVCSATVAGLVNGGLRTMSLGKMKVAMAILLAASVAGGLAASAGARRSVPDEGEPHAQVAACLRVQARALQAPAKTQSPSKKETAAPPPTLDPDDPLDAALLRWQKAVDKVERAAASFSRTDKDHQLKSVTVWKGTFRYLKPNQWVLEQRRKDKPEESQKWARDGKVLWQFAPRQRQIIEYVIPEHVSEPKSATWLERGLARLVGDAVESNFLLGMSAENAKRRYDLKISKGKEKDPYYVYIDIRPRAEPDKLSFAAARLVLQTKTDLPRQFWVQQLNGDETTWDITELKIGIKLTRDDLKLSVPEGWDLIRLLRSGKEPAVKDRTEK